jgi:hypothetical protein
MCAIITANFSSLHSTFFISFSSHSLYLLFFISPPFSTFLYLFFVLRIQNVLFLTVLRVIQFAQSVETS